jgi:hypothetical protein
MRGGKRANAGRPKGAKDGSGTSRAVRQEITKQIAIKASEEGILPLEVMIQAMREAWEAGDKSTAVQVAEKAAPYMHHKLAAVTHSGDQDNPVAYQIMSGVTRQDDPTNDDDQPHATH